MLRIMLCFQIPGIILLNGSIWRNSDIKFRQKSTKQTCNQLCQIPLPDAISLPLTGVCRCILHTRWGIFFSFPSLKNTPYFHPPVYCYKTFSHPWSTQQHSCHKLKSYGKLINILGSENAKYLPN